jgi:hypothetical protein
MKQVQEFTIKVVFQLEEGEVPMTDLQFYDIVEAVNGGIGLSDMFDPFPSSVDTCGPIIRPATAEEEKEWEEIEDEDNFDGD